MKKFLALTLAGAMLLATPVMAAEDVEDEVVEDVEDEDGESGSKSPSASTVKPKPKKETEEEQHRFRRLKRLPCRQPWYRQRPQRERLLASI